MSKSRKVSIVPSLLWTAAFGINVALCVSGIQSGHDVAAYGIMLGATAALIATEWLSYLWRRQFSEWEDLATRAVAAAKYWHDIVTQPTDSTDH